MRLKYILSPVFLLFVATVIGWGQSPMGLYYMETIPQSSHINPAMQPRANGFMALPSINQLFQSDVAFRDVFQDVGSEWVSPMSVRFDYSKLYKATGGTINFNENLDFSLWGFGFRSGRDYFTFSLNFKNVTQFGLPSDFLKIMDKGFPEGEVYNFSKLRMKQMVYKEMHIGYSREFTDKLTFGLHIKPLWGMAAGYTDINTFRLETSQSEWLIHADGNVHVSGPIVVESGEPGEFPESIEAKDMDDNDYMKYLARFHNPGVAVDFGGVYKFNKRLSFSAALTNLGYINWKEDLNTLSFNGLYSFQGIDVDANNRDNLDEAFEAVMDSLEASIQFGISHDKFRTPLTPLFYAGASFHVTPSISLGFLSRTTMQKENLRQDFNLSANIQPYSFVAFNMNYSIRTSGGSGIGTGMSFLIGPLQLYFLADYLTVHHTTAHIDGDEIFMLPRQKDLSVKVGLNLIFGRHGFRDRPMLTVID
jgi:hypothetical protein